MPAGRKPNMPSKPTRSAPKPSFGQKLVHHVYRKKDSWVRQGLRGAGTALGALLGGPAGGTMGSMAGNAIATLIGAGAYRQGEIKMNTSFNKLPENGTLHAGVPAMHKVGSDVRVSHREYVCEVISSSSANTFKVDKYPINPALRTSFPWLSSVAQQYEQYKLHGCVFEFRSNSGNALNSTNTALGSVVMGASYRPSTSTPTNKQQIMNYEWANETVPSKDMIMGIECDPASLAYKQYFTRGSNTLPTDDSVNQYDVANLYIASSGCQGTNVVLGSLYVSYDFELQHSIDTADIGQWLHQSKYTIPAQTISTTNAGASPFKGALVVSDGIGISITTDDTVVFPIGTVGKYMIICHHIGASNVIGTWTTLTFTNCTALAQTLPGSSNMMLPSSGETSVQDCIIQAISIADPSKIATVKMNNTGLTSNWTSGELYVMQLGNGVF